MAAVGLGMDKIITVTDSADEACRQALRVEAEIARLDANYSGREEWRAAVAEWRHCVQRFGPGSASANGALLGLACVVRPPTGWVHSLTGPNATTHVANVLGKVGI